MRTSSAASYCFNGVTRANVIALCQATCAFRSSSGNFPLARRLRGADEAFVTGTFGGLTPVREMDGRVLPARCRGR